MEENKGYQYMHRAADLMEAIQKSGKLQDDRAVIDALIKQKDLVVEIAGNVRTAPAFEKGTDEYLSFTQAINTSIEDRRDRLTAVWNHFIERISEAPTQLHMASVVIMCIPAVEEYLLDYIAHTEEKKDVKD